MSVVSAYPLLRSVLGKLLELESEDMLLPIDILVRLHAQALRAPLLQHVKLVAHQYAEAAGLTDWACMMRLASEIAYGVREHFEQLYPNFDPVNIFGLDESLIDASGKITGQAWFMATPGDLPTDPIVKDLFLETSWAWPPYEPLVLLHLLADQLEQLDGIVQVLEIELALHPAVAHMMLTRLP